MALNFDTPPTYDRMVDEHGMLTPIWKAWFTNFSESLSDYLGQFGIALPVVTTAQRDKILDPPDGLVIQNTTLGEPQVRNNGAWKDILHS